MDDEGGKAVDETEPDKGLQLFGACFGPVGHLDPVVLVEEDAHGVAFEPAGDRRRLPAGVRGQLVGDGALQPDSRRSDDEHCFVAPESSAGNCDNGRVAIAHGAVKDVAGPGRSGQGGFTGEGRARADMPGVAHDQYQPQIHGGVIGASEVSRVASHMPIEGSGRPMVTGKPEQPWRGTMSTSRVDVDYCIAADSSNGQWSSTLAHALHGLGGARVVTVRASSPERHDVASATRSLLTVLPSTKRGLVVSERWAEVPFEAYAVLTARALGVAVHIPSPEGTEIGREIASAVDGLPDSVQAAAAPAHLTAADSPDQDLSERPHEEAARIVHGPRGNFYDHPFDNFSRTAHVWNAVLYSKLKPGESVAPEDVSLCMVGVKIAREAFRHKRDNLTDAHGYLMTHDMVLEERARRERDDR